MHGDHLQLIIITVYSTVLYPAFLFGGGDYKETYLVIQLFNCLKTINRTDLDVRVR
jgi:hypothetical protein